MLSIGIEKPLPLLRADIEIFSAPSAEDGAPAYVIHDPLSGRFAKIGWEEAMVFRRLRTGRTLPALMRELNEQTTLSLNPDEVTELCEEARRQGLTMDTLVKPVDQLLENARAARQSAWSWLARTYLYLRIPLINPDRLLAKALPKVRWLVSRPAVALYICLALAGLYFLSQRFESYVATFSYFTSVHGVIAFGAVIVFLKIAHEFGHAFVAKHHGLRVPAMGLALMVFFPVAYSDVTDAWRLRSRRQRMQITLAGIQVELVIGAAALAVWGITPPGIVNSACFMLSSTTLLSTLLVNLNPAMRFDGYYLLSDLWGVDNLSSQSTAYTKWCLWRLLLGLDAPPPIERMSPRRRQHLVLYALYAWHYRLFLYLGIAVLVYHKFTKPLGITLFVLEIFLFIIRPVLMEIAMLRKQTHKLSLKRFLLVVAAVLLPLIAWTAWPMPRSAKAPAVYLAAHSRTIYTPRAGRIVQIAKQRGDRVAPGDLLIQIESQDLDQEIAERSIAVRQRRHTIAQLKGNPDHLGLVPEMDQQLASANAELAALMVQKKQLSILAEMEGVVAELDDLLRPGGYVMENQVLGRVVAPDGAFIEAFLSEKEVVRIPLGTLATFYPTDRSGRITGRIEKISPIREEYVELTDIGSVAAKELPLTKEEGGDRLAFVESYYKVRIVPSAETTSGIRFGTGGHLRLRTEKYSLIMAFWRYCYSVLIRESGF